MNVPTALLAFCVAAACHAGFQVTVSALVYPALVRVPIDGWSTAHARHSRAIAPIVGIVYGALLVTGCWVVVTERTLASVAAVMIGAGALAVTAALAAPLHGRLSSPEPALLRRLLVVDRARAVLAVGCLAAAVVAL